MAHIDGESIHFDLHEKVKLDRTSAPIQAITTMELKPDIQVEQDTEHILIKGYLLLKGEYTGGTEEQLEGRNDLDLAPFQYQASGDVALELIEHRIPVDIRLPLEKVAQTADIRAEVTVFDFTLLSPYELEIVAEMEIFGLQLLNAVKASMDDEAASSAGEQPEAVTDKAGYETVLVGYQPDNKEPEPSEEAEAADQEQDMIKQDERKSETENENTFVFRALAVGQEDPEQEKGSGGKERLNNVIHFRPNDQTVESRNKQEQEEKEAEQERAVSGESPMAGDGYAEKAGEPEESEASENDRDDVQSDQAVEAKIDDSSDFDREEGWEEDGQDVKVAITGKSIRETDEPLRVASFLQNKLLKQQEAQAETAENETDVEAVHPGIQTGKESAKKRQIEQFSSVKMRIVQRGDTWESIADYYQMDVAAIIKANGSQSELLEEGQVLIIPSSRRR